MGIIPAKDFNKTWHLVIDCVRGLFLSYEECRYSGEDASIISHASIMNFANNYNW